MLARTTTDFKYIKAGIFYYFLLNFNIFYYCNISYNFRFNISINLYIYYIFNIFFNPNRGDCRRLFLMLGSLWSVPAPLLLPDLLPMLSQCAACLLLPRTAGLE